VQRGLSRTRPAQQLVAASFRAGQRACEGPPNRSALCLAGSVSCQHKTLTSHQLGKRRPARGSQLSWRPHSAGAGVSKRRQALPTSHWRGKYAATYEKAVDVGRLVPGVPFHPGGSD